MPEQKIKFQVAYSAPIQNETFKFTFGALKNSSLDYQDIKKSRSKQRCL